MRAQSRTYASSATRRARSETRRRIEEARARRMERRAEFEERRAARAEEVMVAPAGISVVQIDKITSSDDVTVSDLRDEVVGAIRRAGLSFVEIERRGGAKAQTLSKWEAKETKNPHLLSMRKTLRALGMDIQLA